MGMYDDDLSQADRYDRMAWQEIFQRFDWIEQLGLQDEYQDQSCIELPIKVTKKDKGSEQLKVLWGISVAKQLKYRRLEAEHRAKL